ncbi:MAG: response regulator [Pirellulaceae bacterium]|nr:response regulator [Pirellulaceae bacterium]
MLSHPQVYVIDDEEAVRHALAGLLKASGFTVETFPSAVNFLKGVDLDRVGVVIADLAMPEMNGDELLRELKVKESPLAIIIVTGVADVKIAVQVMESGALTLLEKPFSGDDMLTAVRSGLSRSLAHQAEKVRRDSVSRIMAGLDEDERGIVTRMIEGKSIKSCSFELNLSTRTIERRRKDILKTFGVSSILELAMLVMSARRQEPRHPQAYGV